MKLISAGMAMARLLDPRRRTRFSPHAPQRSATATQRIATTGDLLGPVRRAGAPYPGTIDLRNGGGGPAARRGLTRAVLRVLNYFASSASPDEQNSSPRLRRSAGDASVSVRAVCLTSHYDQIWQCVEEPRRGLDPAADEDARRRARREFSLARPASGHPEEKT